MFSLERDEEMRRLTRESQRLVMTSVNSEPVSVSRAPANGAGLRTFTLTLRERIKRGLKKIQSGVNEVRLFLTVWCHLFVLLLIKAIV